MNVNHYNANNIKMNSPVFQGYISLFGEVIEKPACIENCKDLMHRLNVNKIPFEIVDTPIEMGMLEYIFKFHKNDNAQAREIFGEVLNGDTFQRSKIYINFEDKDYIPKSL